MHGSCCIGSSRVRLENACYRWLSVMRFSAQCVPVGYGAGDLRGGRPIRPTGGSRTGSGDVILYTILYAEDLDRSIPLHRDLLGLPFKFEQAGYAGFATPGTRFAPYERTRLPELSGCAAAGRGPAVETLFLVPSSTPKPSGCARPGVGGPLGAGGPPLGTAPCTCWIPTGTWWAGPPARSPPAQPPGPASRVLTHRMTVCQILDCSAGRGDLKRPASRFVRFWSPRLFRSPCSRCYLVTTHATQCQSPLWPLSSRNGCLRWSSGVWAGGPRKN
jgi:lactoylglutathione lyase